MRAMIVALLMLAAGCVTGYQPKGFTGGYEDFEVNDGVYQVTYHGNGYTPARTVSDLWLRRCADIARGHGAPYFEVLAVAGATDTQVLKRSTQCTGTTSGDTITAECSGGDKTVNRHQVVGRIRLLPGTSESPNVYKTDSVLRALAH